MSDIEAAQQKLTDALARLEAAVETWAVRGAGQADEATATATRIDRLEKENAQLAALAVEAGERLDSAIDRINQALAGGD
jgi:hypothetical protein